MRGLVVPEVHLFGALVGEVVNPKGVRGPDAILLAPADPPPIAIAAVVFGVMLQDNRQVGLEGALPQLPLGRARQVGLAQVGHVLVEGVGGI